MPPFRHYAGRFLNETQADGASFLIRGIPRSFLILLGLFLVVYLSYWASALGGAPEQLQQGILHILGLIVGMALAVTTLRIWPRLEAAVPRWFRGESEGAALPRHHKYLAWALAGGVIVVCTVGIVELTFLSVILMGLVGGIYILYRVETAALANLEDWRRRLKWLWTGSGWRPFVFLLLIMVLLIIAVTVVASSVGLNENPETHEVKFLPTLAVLIPSIALAVQFAVIAFFVLIQMLRALIRRRQARGSTVSPRQGALLRTHPASIAYYLTVMNFATAAFLMAYTLLIVVQTIGQARAQGAIIPIDIGGAWLSSELLDYVALASFAFAWILLLLNLSGTAVKGQMRLLNRRTFASLSVFFLMILFMHVIVARGDEFTITIIFRGTYVVGIILAPLLIIWRRWKRMGSAAEPSPLPASVLPQE